MSMETLFGLAPLILAGIVLALAVAIAWLAYELRNAVRRYRYPSDALMHDFLRHYERSAQNPLSDVDRYSADNFYLSSKSGEPTLARFLLSEAMLDSKLDTLGARMAESPVEFANYAPSEDRELAERAAQQAKNESWLTKIKKKAFDSLNSYVRKRVGNIFGAPESEG